ncbi:MAG: TonB-dependent siderophore receptor, partial [Burkholderiales bacterium PBB5]
MPTCHRFESITMAHRRFRSSSALAGQQHVHAGTRRQAPTRLALAVAALLAGSAWAQDSSLTVTVSGRNAANAASVAGFGDVPLSRAPFSASVISARQLQDAGIDSLADITRLDAGITDAYNAPGYWNQVAVRGFTLDARQNVRRDGLPINAETVIPSGNKSALEILKGTSGLQAGTSTPGGLLNLVVARPTGSLRSASLDWTQPGTVGAAFDLGERSGAEGAYGWRVHGDADRLNPSTRNSRGQRWMASAAVDARLAAGSLLEAEVEASRQSQPSTPGFSLLGNRLPSASSIDPRLNLNNQAWSLPVVFNGRTGSLRFTQALASDVNLVAHVMRQQLTTDDRIAFPFGCSAENAFDRYCSDGSFDVYDFRSEGERRTSDAADLSIQGKAAWGVVQHRFNAGVLASRYNARFQRQAFNWVGTDTLAGNTAVPADPSLTDENTNRHERSTEWHLQDAITLSPKWSVWAGLRHSRLQRDSVRTDDSRATAYAQGFTTPWLALSHAFNAQDIAYLSWGQGVE